MSEKIELKPCPFCGGDFDLLEDEGAYLPRCEDCDYDFQGGTVGIGWFESKEKAADAVNHRPIEDAQAARIAELERTVDDLRGELAQSDRVADKTRIAELEAALLEIVRLSTPNSVCANCKHCEEICGGDYCRLTGKELEDASSQECEKFEVGGFIVPGTHEIARKALETSK